MKKILSLMLVIVIALSVPTLVTAESTGVTYACDNGYTAIKLSHPDTYSGEVDGLIEYNGENDRGQNYAWSSVGYGDYVYVGTCFGAIYQTLRYIAIQNNMEFSKIETVVNALFNGSLYIGDEGEETTKNRSCIVKINTKTYETTIVDGPNKFGGFRAATVFNNKLYFATTSSTPYLLEIDPENNDAKQIVCYSETPQSAAISTGIRGLTSYRDMLIATMIGNDGAYIVASSDPSSGPESFEKICTQEDLFNYPAYRYTDSIFGGSIWDIIEYNDKIYFSVVTGTSENYQAFALFSGQLDEHGEWSFELIAGDEENGAKYPFGLGSERSGAANLMVYDGYLYIGGYNDPMIALPQALTGNFEPLYSDLSSPVCLWRLDENNSIEMVAGDANEVFPEGPIGNMSAGFDSNMNQYVWRMESYNGKLFVGTLDLSSLAYPIMQFTNGDILNMSQEDFDKQIEYIKDLIDMMSPQSEATDDEVVQNEKSVASVGANLNTAALSKNAEKLASLSDELDSTDMQTRIDLYNAMHSMRDAYLSIRDYLPESVTSKLDTFLNEEKIDNFYYFIKCCSYLSKGERGFDLFVTEDGMNFDTITRDGFGDPYNHGCRVFAITDSGLCVGTANPFYGAQVWLIDETVDIGYELGDVTRDGYVDILDATAIQMYMASLTEFDDEQIALADFDGDTYVSVLDATGIQLYLAKLVD